MGCELITELVSCGYQALSDENKERLAELLISTDDEIVIATILTALKLAESELIGDDLCIFRSVLNLRRERTISSNLPTIDLAGTGGDRKDYFNISTIAAVVLASISEGKYNVVKHGNFGSNGRGSSDVLRALGYDLNGDNHEENLTRCNLTFAHAPKFYPFLKTAGGVRKRLPFRTIFNLLGPILTPVDNCVNFLGVSNRALLPLYQSYFDLSDSRSSIINSIDGSDEITSLPFAFSSNSYKCCNVGYFSDKFSKNWGDNKTDLFVCSDIRENVDVFLGVLRQDNSFIRHTDVVCANVAVARYVVGLSIGDHKIAKTLSTEPDAFEKSLERNFIQAKESIASGRALNTLKALLQICIF